ncbi:Pre-peptidase C-terminal domain-containing protein [Sulfidibacter corallicola]|uniref:Pre-peptidase C-terminal domain-containing protein n=1 Tax=Sulfidibacter corallicola TaxID=2818388 RepID=A0A8A4TYY1_SULCO|nr:PPC domain-containing protein [Sulfidibacter corallicola]QTD54304.1 pre-peptidase C-terminal domain-containing protein [Sulfidibacter corallicola]
MLSRVLWVLFAALPMVTAGEVTTQNKTDLKPDGSYFVNADLWTSDYLSLRKDQMVHGESYRGYPGPLPKLFYALGQDPNHPAIDWELLNLVDREALTWEGACNGWAISTFFHEEPEAIVFNGIRFMPGELKAMLASIYRANQARVSGGGATGLSAQALHDFLMLTVADGFQVVFDVDISDQIWNYPVHGFDLVSQQDGDYTNVTATVYYPALVTLNDNNDFLPLDTEIYTYRFLTETQSSYEYTGNSVEAHPQRAWFPGEFYYKGQWLLIANHYYYRELYFKLFSSGLGFGVEDDLYEPNNAAEAAVPFRDEFVYGSLTVGDVDYYSVDLKAGQRLQVEFEIYDGNPATFAWIDPEGNERDAQDRSEGHTLDITAETAGTYRLKVAHDEFYASNSYYTLEFPKDAGSFWLGQGQLGDELASDAFAINTRAAENSVDAQALAPYGGVALAKESGRVWRSSERTIWAESWKNGDTMHKKLYHRDHVMKTRYIAPHITFRNGWKTRLEVFSEKAGVPVTMVLHADNGNVIRSVELPFNGSTRYENFLDRIPGIGSLSQVAWFELTTASDNPLKGTVCFENARGNYVMIDLETRPGIGEMMVFDLKSEAEGGTGLALLNVADVENEVLYSLETKSGDVIAEGGFFLGTGEKMLNTVADLTSSTVTNDMILFVHAQYPLDGLVVQYQMDPYFMYGHRILRDSLDEHYETFVRLPEDRNLVTLMVANLGTANNQPLFEGYSADGTLQGRFNMNIQRALSPKEVKFVDVATIFENGVDILDLDAITHFRIRSPKPFFAVELYGTPQTSTFMGIPLPLIYENP